MNRFPVWVYALVGLCVLAAALFTSPNFYGESPAVQVSSLRAATRVDAALLNRIEGALRKAGISHTGTLMDESGVRLRFADIDTQLKAQDVIGQELVPDAANPSYVVAPNLLSASPSWMSSIRARPMYLGLDLRGGVHFLLQVDLKSALTKRLDALVGDLRAQLREKGIRHGGVVREDEVLRLRFRAADARDTARDELARAVEDLQFQDGTDAQDHLLVARLKPEAEKRLQEGAVRQNIVTLSNRVNELGVAEPVIQQQGSDRIVVQLPGVQDITRAKEILGRTATLEVRLVDTEARVSGNTFNVDVFPERQRDGTVTPVPVRKQVVITGDHFTGAQATFDQDGRPAVAVELDQSGGRVMRLVTRENIEKPMAIILFEKGRGEAISVATIKGEFGSRFQITGLFSPQETATLALLIRAGSL
ncbi:MAG: SecDF P1 head subdomain-containing protein, partial [Geminicoccales bacterium]